MNYHHLQVVSDEGEAPRLRLVCTAPPDAFCRKRPKDDRETWDHDSDLEPGRRCLWAEWAEDGGWDTIQVEEEGILLSAPIDIYYDEGPVISIATPEPTGAEVTAATHALMDALDAEGAEVAGPEDWTAAIRAALVAAWKVRGR